MSKTQWTGLLFASASAVAIAMPALAQTAGAAPKDATQVGAVIVTAQRRSEDVEKVPVAISVVSASTLKATNYSGLTDLQYVVPSLQYNSYQGGGFQIRGVGTQSFNVSEEQDVAVVIDDVVQGLPETNLAPPSYQALNDIDHIEVLKGPQGTLFGKNSSAGVLNIVTRQPQLHVYSDEGSISYGSQNEFKAQDTVNLPLGDDAAARISAFNIQRDGFIHNLYTGQTIGAYDEYGGRVKVRWEPTDKFDVGLILDYTHTTNNGNGIWTLRSCGSGFYGFSPCAMDAPYGVTASAKNLSGAWDGYIGSTSDSAGGSLHINYKLGEDTLTLVTSAYDLHEYGGVDVDQTPLRTLSVDTRPDGSTQFTQEVRLSSPSDQFVEYTVGAFYYDVTTHDADTLAGTYNVEANNAPNLLANAGSTPAGGGQARSDVTTISYAAFGQATLHLTSQFNLTGGVRYTHDDVKEDQYTAPVAGVCEFDYAFGGPCHVYALPTARTYLTTSASNVSGKIGAEYHFTPEAMAYVTIAKGYKGPAVNLPPDGSPGNAILPETSTDYEVGLKTQLFEHKVVFNIDAFYTKYVNFQGQEFVVNAANPSASAFETANAGGLETKGIEADLTYRPTPEWTLSGSGAYLPTRFTAFNIQCGSAAANPSTGACTVPSGVPGINLFSAAGYPLPNAPEYVYTLSANYRHDLANGYTFNGNLNWNWRSSTYTVVADPNTIQPGYGILGLNLGIGPQTGRWQISAFARNLLNQYYTGGIFASFFDSGPGLAHPVQGYSNIPAQEAQRTFGVRLDFKFGG